MLTPVTAGVHVEVDDARAIVRVSGEIDIATTPEVDEAVARLTTPDIVLDLSEVTFMGSSGLASLLRASRRATELGGSLVLRQPSRAVRDLLEMTHLTDRFTIADE
jgi:anti-sigma B factor antagonist